ncbi:MAG TPA: serine protease [Myxococcales bacterium]|jgi:S1-C subfamily serine protease
MTTPRLLMLLVALASAPARAEGELPIGELAKRVGPSIARLGMFADGKQRGNGTGFFVRQDGIAVTNHHVIEHVDGEFVAVLPDGTRHAVLGLLADDEAHDLAIIKVEGANFPVLPLAGSASVAVGAPAYLIGSSMGLDQSLGVGVVSAIRDSYPEDWVEGAKKAGKDLPQGPIVQHTANSAAGSSGSPLLNGRGEVIAVHHSSLIDSPIYFAAHVDALRALLARTDLDAPPKPLGPDKTMNLVVSLAFFVGLGLAGGVYWGVKRWRAPTVH